MPHSYLWCLTRVAWCRYDRPHLLQEYLLVAGSRGDSLMVGFSSMSDLLRLDWSIREGNIGASPGKNIGVRTELGRVGLLRGWRGTNYVY